MKVNKLLLLYIYIFSNQYEELFTYGLLYFDSSFSLRLCLT